jgi:hypothetical protein
MRVVRTPLNSKGIYPVGFNDAIYRPKFMMRFIALKK